MNQIYQNNSEEKNIQMIHIYIKLLNKMFCAY